jgi:hypothetical protein
MDQRVEAERKVDRIVRERGKRGAVIDHVTDVRAFGEALCLHASIQEAEGSTSTSSRHSASRNWDQRP